ncbi:superantigen-like protein SSL4 [Bythopirellula goksoeyrii]|uniref:Uncharacterized protein n=1 Tax=Bythopirellula goksoeyrii TaxID=1400387 RepID=A0A5B9QNJ0_9BACT|nr:hypothetical protein [Bythopirellula goksoeyrii]QEG35563.1 hypothetical protein Pr1d_28640 [Bythopirellula goksoeyrii]
MSEMCLIFCLLLFGQLGDRYPISETDSVLPLDLSEEASSSPAEQPPQDSAETDSTAGLFEDSPQDTLEQNTIEGSTETDPITAVETPVVTPPSETSKPAPPATTSVPSTSTADSPDSILKSFSESVSGSQLPGTPVALTEVIASSPTRREQTQHVEAYWDLSQAVLDYNLALKETIELATLRRGIAQAGPQWEHSLNLAKSREQLALERAQVAQQRVAAILSLTSEDHAPLPSDFPFVGTYNTRFSELFPLQNSISQEQTPRIAKEYDGFLTGAAGVIENQAKEISNAREWMFTVSEQRSPNTDGKELLTAYELFAARRRLFVQTVADYNRAIVRYTELATPGTVEPQRLVAMLIRVEGTPATTVDSAVRRTSAEEQLDSSDVSRSQSRSTPENSWNALPNNAERSILVPRR